MNIVFILCVIAMMIFAFVLMSSLFIPIGKLIVWTYERVKDKLIN